MANEQRGEVDIVVGDKTYTLRLSINAIIEAEQRTHQTFGDIVKSLQAFDIATLRDLVWMLLKKHHAADFPTIETVGDLIDEAGPILVAEKVARAFRLNAWTPPGGAANGRDPRKAQGRKSTGVKSTSAHDASR